jgi:hypothetical protein
VYDGASAERKEQSTVHRGFSKAILDGEAGLRDSRKNRERSANEAHVRARSALPWLLE